MQSLMMLGSDYCSWGEVSVQHLAQASLCISPGSSPNSPSMIHKVGVNEDAGLILHDESSWLFALTDGHHGPDVSHALIRGLASACRKIPQRLGQLSLLLGSEQIELADCAGGSTLLVACLNVKDREVLGFSFGDCSIVTVGSAGATARNRLSDFYLRAETGVDLERANSFQFRLAAGERLLMYSDGINECCYRDPHRSVQLSHVHELGLAHPEKVGGLVESLAQLALQGVGGHPGGQDNLVVLGWSES